MSNDFMTRHGDYPYQGKLINPTIRIIEALQWILLLAKGHTDYTTSFDNVDILWVYDYHSPNNCIIADCPLLFLTMASHSSQTVCIVLCYGWSLSPTLLISTLTDNWPQQFFPIVACHRYRPGLSWTDSATEFFPTILKLWCCSYTVGMSNKQHNIIFLGKKGNYVLGTPIVE